MEVSSLQTTNKDWMNTRDCKLFKVFGVESHLLSPEETKALYPLMNVDDIYGTLYSPQDGTIDPHGLCTALSRYATRAGAKVVENCAVTSVMTRPGSLGSRVV